MKEHNPGCNCCEEIPTEHCPWLVTIDPWVWVTRASGYCDDDNDIQLQWTTNWQGNPSPFSATSLGVRYTLPFFPFVHDMGDALAEGDTISVVIEGIPSCNGIDANGSGNVTVSGASGFGPAVRVSTARGNSSQPCCNVPSPGLNTCQEQGILANFPFVDDDCEGWFESGVPARMIFPGLVIEGWPAEAPHNGFPPFSLAPDPCGFDYRIGGPPGCPGEPPVQRVTQQNGFGFTTEWFRAKLVHTNPQYLSTTPFNINPGWQACNYDPCQNAICRSAFFSQFDNCDADEYCCFVEGEWVYCGPGS